MNKKIEKQQLWLHNRWFEKNKACIIQPMFFQKKDGIWYQKEIL